ncbi:capsule biosynthesis protein [Sphingomonas piscis]|uniref:Capsule biosynthesis protein n=1 Tax=Sphingomonas piscis TaxID=2714943 RepID=A0A6G7YMW0_9SPHN|nr:capsule biosynthesis protein [Sphingomonas piscis]QIK78056.1 capsule biosynthesis protein [Sphingomonas piscis]
MNRNEAPDFFRVPPFPGARPASLMGPHNLDGVSGDDAHRLIAMLAERRVGGSFWGARPALPTRPYTLVRAQTYQRFGGQETAAPLLFWQSDPDAATREGHTIYGECDPWHLVNGATEVIAEGSDELVLVAAIAGVPVHCVSEGCYSQLAADPASLPELFKRLFLDTRGYADPFTRQPITLAELIELLTFWKELIDSNRQIEAAVGFAFWKQPTVAPLLWNGSTEVRFINHAATEPDGAVAIWKSRTPTADLAALEESGVRLLEVEDGFIRSAGLGADCVPPLSIIVDRSGIYFDPTQPSDLESLLHTGNFDAGVLERARHLREIIVASGISKYEQATAHLKRRVPRAHLLVPGQVEDDRSVQSGGGDVRTNLELLKRVRRTSPDAYILYKPHPDVEAGHRIGAVPEAQVLQFADEIVRDLPISALIDLCDEVHVNTSLAGFEALLRGKAVTTHGVPFYAGWGLTRDLGAVPARRAARRSLDELVAATLMLYPRYLDPHTGLPCPPEILVKRLADGQSQGGNHFLVAIRRLQGRLKRAMAKAMRR